MRLYVIATLAGLVIVGELVLMSAGRFGSTESAALGAVLAVLLPALLDALALERRRRVVRASLPPGSGALNGNKPQPREDDTGRFL